MKAHPNAIFIGITTLATLALTEACSCQRPIPGSSVATVDSVAPDAWDLDTASNVGELIGPKDTIMEVDTPQEVVDQESTDIVSGVDVAEDEGPSPICTAVKLPEAGASCMTEGTVRCSNANAEVRDWATNMGIGCFRPNQLICSKVASGELRWVLESCENVMGVPAGVPGATCLTYASCIVRSDGDHG